MHDLFWTFTMHTFDLKSLDHGLFFRMDQMIFCCCYVPITNLHPPYLSVCVHACVSADSVIWGITWSLSDWSANLPRVLTVWHPSFLPLTLPNWQVIPRPPANLLLSLHCLHSAPTAYQPTVRAFLHQGNRHHAAREPLPRQDVLSRSSSSAGSVTVTLGSQVGNFLCVD